MLLIFVALVRNFASVFVTSEILQHITVYMDHVAPHSLCYKFSVTCCTYQQRLKNFEKKIEIKEIFCQSIINHIISKLMQNTDTCWKLI